jgi:hypothetical protein
MKKLITTLATLIVLVVLGILGINYLRTGNPRERVKIEDGSSMIVEELSYYSGGDKVFGRLYRPSVESAEPEATPAVIYFHEPLKTAWPESLMKSLVSKGLSGYACGFRGKAKDAVTIVKRLGRESFSDPDMLFIISDASCADEILLAASKLGQKIQGLILIEPNPTGKSREIYLRYGKEFLTIDSAGRGDALNLIEDYLEERGALK